MTSSGPVVFLAHSTADKELVRKFHKLLRIDGFNPWLDEVELIGGQKWELEFATAIRGSDAVVAFLSERSTNHQGYIHKELELALDVAQREPEANIFIIPLRIGPAAIPTRLRHLQWVQHEEQGGISNTYLHLRRALIKRANQVSGSGLPLPDGANSDVVKFSGTSYGKVLPKEAPIWKREGLYLVLGNNPSGEIYVGLALLRVEREIVLMEARIGAEVFTYTGSYDGNQLTFNGQHCVVYDTYPRDGVLRGSWGEGGVEELIPASPFAIRDLGKMSHNPPAPADG